MGSVKRSALEGTTGTGVLLLIILFGILNDSRKRMIKTFLRLRPVSLLESQKSQLAVEGNNIEITIANNKYNYEYDHVIDSSMSQEAIFGLVVST